MKAQPAPFAAMVVLVLSFHVAQPAAAQEDSVTVQAGAQYGAIDIGRFFLGSRYRDLWTTPVRVPVLSPDTFAGGLELLQRGGGQQTASLRFGSEDGREWVFRSVDKDQTGGLHEDLKETLVDDVVQDQISSKHPGAALVVAPLLEAAGVLHVTPRLAVMADHPLLGEYRSEFAGMLGMIEERPDEQEAEDGKPYRFRGHERVIGTDRFLERLREGPEDRPEPRAFLRARLMDFLVGDWDRHEDQWRWAQVDRDDRRYWLPIPRDRDNAFFFADGVIGHAGAMIRPFVIQFDEEYPSPSGLTYNARPLDQLILPALALDEWYEVAYDVQRRLTDEVIADAVAQLPDAYYEASGAELERKLRARRDRLPELVPDFYERVVHEANVFATDEAEDVEVVRESDGAVTVRLEGEDGLFFDRRFIPGETREVRLFLHGGDDRAVVRGSSRDGILVRVIGGAGDDHLEDATTRGSGRTVFYDAAGENQFVRGPETRVDRQSYDPPDVDSPTQNNEPPVRDWGASHTLFAPMVDWESEIGPVVGFGPQWTRYGFRRVPFATQFGVELQAAPLELLFGVEVDARRRLTGDRGETRFNAFASQIEVTRFHGYGNDTPDGANPDRMLVWENRVGARASMTRLFSDRWTVGFGPEVTWVDPEPQLGSPAAFFQVPGSESFGVGGVAMRGIFDSRDSEIYPRSGAFVTADVSAYPLVWGDAPEAFVRSTATARTYLPLPLPLESTLALRAGGEHVFGDPPIQYAATLGGGSSLRGHRTDRFTGDLSVFGTAELRTSLGRVDLYVARGDIGTIALADVGRVFASGMDSDTWHSAFGGGLWFGPVDREFTGHVTFSVGERQSLSAGLGVPF